MNPEQERARQLIGLSDGERLMVALTIGVFGVGWSAIAGAWIAAASVGERLDVSGQPAIEVRTRGDGAISADFAVGTARMLAHGGRAFQPMEYESDTSAPGNSFVHDEDEFVYVLSGEVCVELDGAVSLLEPSQSAYYRGGIPHRWWSASGGAYRLLVVKQGPRLSPSGR